MEAWLNSLVEWLMTTLALPGVGLGAVLVVSTISATLLPLGSEPAVYGLIRMSPEMFWPTILVATLGNTIGGSINYAIGYGADKAYERWREKHPYRPRSKAGGRFHDYIDYWAHRLGPPVLLFSWLPILGDPLCAVAGFLRLPFWQCAVYMAIGKFLRYLLMTIALLWFFPGH